MNCGIASHPAYNNPPQDQNLRYKLDLYGKSGQSNTSNDWNYVGPVRIVDKTREADGYYHGPITDPDRFGQIDLTGFENGVYQLKLTVQVPGNYDWLSSDAYAQLSSTARQDRPGHPPRKIWLSPSAASLFASSAHTTVSASPDGPFGHGWAYTIAGMDIELNEQRIPMPLYEDRYQMYSIRVSDNFDRNVTLTLPDGQKVTFQFYLKYDKGSWGEFGDYVAKYRSPQGITDKLETLKQERFKVNPDVGGFGYLWNGQGGDVQGTQDPAHYDFSGYRLTTADGNKICLNGRITDFQAAENSSGTIGVLHILSIPGRSLFVGNSVAHRRDHQL